MAKSKPETSAGGPEAILPLTDFRADVWGDGNPVSFKAGILSSPVPADFARQMRDEGKAAPRATPPAPAPEQPVD